MSPSTVQMHGVLVRPLGVTLRHLGAFNPNYCLIIYNPFVVDILPRGVCGTTRRKRIVLNCKMPSIRDTFLQDTAVNFMQQWVLSLGNQQLHFEMFLADECFLGGGFVSWKTRTSERHMPRCGFMNASWSSFPTDYLVRRGIIPLSVRFSATLPDEEHDGNIRFLFFAPSLSLFSGWHGCLECLKRHWELRARLGHNLSCRSDWKRDEEHYWDTIYPITYSRMLSLTPLINIFQYSLLKETAFYSSSASYSFSSLQFTTHIRLRKKALLACGHYPCPLVYSRPNLSVCSPWQVKTFIQHHCQVEPKAADLPLSWHHHEHHNWTLFSVIICSAKRLHGLAYGGLLEEPLLRRILIHFIQLWASIFCRRKKK